MWSPEVLSLNFERVSEADLARRRGRRKTLRERRGIKVFVLRGACLVRWGALEPGRWFHTFSERTAMMRLVCLGNRVW